MRAFTVKLRLLLLTATLNLLSSCGLSKAVIFFFVPEHIEYEAAGECYGIENQPRERLLITDCGGYLNIISSTVTLGLSLSSEDKASAYIEVAKEYLDTNMKVAKLRNFLTWRQNFEIFYSCIDRLWLKNRIFSDL